MYVAFDTETTGLPFNNFAVGHPEYPHVMQIAAILYDDKMEEVNHFSTLIQFPDNIQIHPKAFEAHGITRDECKKYGIPFEIAAMMFNEFVGRSKIQVAHNSAFDTLVIEKTSRLYFDKNPITYSNVSCTMLALTPIMKLESRVKGKFKWPKLSEAYSFAFKETIENAHDALADCRACFRLYKWMNTK